jgi:hypothetical protein
MEKDGGNGDRSLRSYIKERKYLWSMKGNSNVKTLDFRKDCAKEKNLQDNVHHRQMMEDEPEGRDC